MVLVSRRFMTAVGRDETYYVKGMITGSTTDTFEGEPG